MYCSSLSLNKIFPCRLRRHLLPWSSGKFVRTETLWCWYTGYKWRLAVSSWESCLGLSTDCSATNSPINLWNSAVSSWELCDFLVSHEVILFFCLNFLYENEKEKKVFEWNFRILLYLLKIVTYPKTNQNKGTEEIKLFSSYALYTVNLNRQTTQKQTQSCSFLAPWYSLQVCKSYRQMDAGI